MPWPDSSSPPRPVAPGAVAEPTLDPRWARAALREVLGEAGAPGSALQTRARFADYELLQRLGQGATGCVYRARHVSLNRLVALKVMRNTDFASEAELQRFQFGAQAAAELDHPNIAPIYHVGEDGGIPFLTMRLFEGGTLAEAGPRLRKSQHRAVVLMAKVARAVQYAHEHGVLHRDLKLANVVLDEHDEPYVVDFGFAKHLDERAVTSKPSLVVGTLGYMAPEQAAGDGRSLTFASDIYSLGAILYELLTGEVPFQARSLAELFQKLTSAEAPRSPRRIDPTIDRELALVCLKCLEKDPSRRYRTAAELADDLERWLRLEPISIPSARGFSGAFRWCRKHPALSTSLAGAVCVLAATTFVALSLTREREEALLGEMLRRNLYAADAKAGQVLSQLRELARPLSRCASDARIVELLGPHNRGSEHASLADRLLFECGAQATFDSVVVIDRDGQERARLPHARALPAREVTGKDFFRGAKRLADGEYRSVHVGRVLRSKADGERSVSLSAPVFDADNAWLGVVSVTVNMGAFLDSLHMSDSADQMAVLAGVREPEPGDPATAENGVIILLHGRLGNAQGGASQRLWLKELTRLKQEAVGHDPFRLTEPNRSLEEDPRAYSLTVFGKRWLAGFAPVGHTGYAVVVQTSYDIVLKGFWRALLRLIGWSGAIFLTGAAFVLLLAWTLERRMRMRRV